MKPFIVVLEGPSGVGKDTVAAGLVAKWSENYIKMPSITSRPMRENESQGNPYFFVTTEEFERKIENGDVFEFTIMTRDNMYRGMSKKIIEDIAKTGKIQLKDCDWVGIEALKREYGKDRVLAVYLDVPRKEIARRIRERGGDKCDIKRRIKDYDAYKKIRDFCCVSVPNLCLDACVDQIHELVQEKFSL